MFEEAKSGALRALDAYEKIGVADVAEGTREFLERIDRDARGSGLGPSRIRSGGGELLDTMLFVVCINHPCPDGIAEPG